MNLMSILQINKAIDKSSSWTKRRIKSTNRAKPNYIRWTNMVTQATHPLITSGIKLQQSKSKSTNSSNRLNNQMNESITNTIKEAGEEGITTSITCRIDRTFNQSNNSSLTLWATWLLNAVLIKSAQFLSKRD